MHDGACQWPCCPRKIRSLCFLVLCETGTPFHVEKVGLLTGLRSLSVFLLEVLTQVQYIKSP